jgi:hypothetical protein
MSFDRLYPIPRDVSDVAARAYGRVLRVDENWHTVGGAGQPSLLSPWYVETVNLGARETGHAIRYVRDRDGRTHLTGQITNSTEVVSGNTTYRNFVEGPIFYLPPGWRPQDLIRLNTVYKSNEGIRGAILNVHPDGLVQIRDYQRHRETLDNGISWFADMWWVSLDGLWFWG